MPAPTRRLRLDRLLVQRGLARTRSEAQALILAGRVYSGERRLDKPGALWAAELPLRVRAGRRFVGRGGYKLQAALEAFAVAVSGRDCLDVGASTGGFTQVLLEAGARRVVALDVGRGQLDWGLRNDPRVFAVEGVNARHLRPDFLPFAVSLAVVDVSFISLALVLPPVIGCLGGDRHPADVVALIKPQFEVGRRKVARGGIVRDPALHREVLDRIAGFGTAHGWGVCGVCASPIEGADGNREFLIHIRPAGPGLDAGRLDRAVRAALGSPPHREESP